jgi:Kae1-associated kinase Bud32
MHSKPEIQDRQDGDRMKIKKLSEGAESCIYSSDFLGLNSVIKRRIVKPYRIKEIDNNLRTERTRNEARIMGLVSSFGVNSPNLLLVDKYDIIMSRVYGSNLNDILNRNGSSSFGKIFPVLGHYAALLHNNNITHGDYTPANIIIGKKGIVYLIDFGLSSITNSIEDKALDILLMKRAIDSKSFGVFVLEYKRECKESGAILKRLQEIEKRGRYNTRTMMTQDPN